MKLKENKLTKKIIIAIIMIILLFNFITPIYSYGGVITNSLLTKPICYFFIRILDGINLTTSLLFCPEATFNDIKDNLFDGEGLGDGTLNFDDLTDIQKSYYMALMSPDKIFRGDVIMLDANIFDAGSTGIQNFLSPQKSLAAGLKETVSNIYVLLRNIAAVALLCLLIYTGIRIVLASNSIYEQTKWRMILVDWVKALCLLIFIHFIMIGIFYISDLLVESMRESFGNNDSIVAAIRWNFNNQSFLDSTACILYLVMYVYVMYLTVLFLVSYFKRLIWVVILIIISPIVAVTYALGKEKQIFQRWFKEFTLTVLIQPFHFLVYYVLLGLPLSLLSGGAAAGSFKLIGTNHSSLVLQLYALLSISMIKPAELFIRNLFGFNASKIAQQAAPESGKKTIDAGVKMVEKTIETGVKIAAVVATAGAAAPVVAGGAAASGTAAAGATSAASGALEAGDAAMATDVAGMAAEEETAAGVDPTGIDPTGEMGEDPTKMPGGKGQGGPLDNNSGGGLPNTEDTAANKMDEAAEKMKEAAEKMKEASDDKTELSDKDLRTAIPDSMETRYNSLKDKVQGKYGSTVDALRGTFYDAKDAKNEFMDTFYVEGSGDKSSLSEGRKKAIEESKKNRLDAFVNNKNNINFMIEEHGLMKGIENCKTQEDRDKKEKAAQDAAKERLKRAEPYLSQGVIGDVRTLDSLISRQESTGKSPKDVLKDFRKDMKIEGVVSKDSNVDKMVQVIARRTGESESSPRVRQEARDTLEQSKQYIKSGEKNPEVLHRLVQLENSLKREKFSSNATSADKIKDMDKIIQKAFEEKAKEIVLPKTEGNKAAIEKLEGIMNRELNQRRDSYRRSLGGG